MPVDALSVSLSVAVPLTVGGAVFAGAPGGGGGGGGGGDENGGVEPIGVNGEVDRPGRRRRPRTGLFDLHATLDARVDDEAVSPDDPTVPPLGHPDGAAHVTGAALHAVGGGLRLRFPAKRSPTATISAMPQTRVIRPKPRLG